MSRRRSPARLPAQLPLPLDGAADDPLEAYVQWVERMWERDGPLTDAERRLASEIAAWAIARGYWNLNLDAELLAARRATQS